MVFIQRVVDEEDDTFGEILVDPGRKLLDGLNAETASGAMRIRSDDGIRILDGCLVL